MLFGDVATFAIECEVTVRFDARWTFGHFRMWAAGQSVGDYGDSADLRGCLNWLVDAVSSVDARCEPTLDDRSKVEVFQLVYDPFMVAIPKGVPFWDIEFPEETDERVSARSAYPDAMNRFHLDHVGMSSFEKWSVLLIERGDGGQRLLWRRISDTEIGECVLRPNCFEDVASEFIDWARVNL